MEEDGKQICRIGDVRCGAEVTYAGRNGTGKLQFGDTVHCSCEGYWLHSRSGLWVVIDTGGVLVLSIEVHGTVCR